MGKSLEIVRIDKATEPEKWLDFRMSGIGASEVAAIMGMSEWKSAHEVYYNKIGVFDSRLEENIAMFQGNRLEPLVAEQYEYWDGTEAGMIKNYYAKNKVRTLYDPKCYVLNPDFPHLFFSPDRLSLKDMDHGKKYFMRGNKMFIEHIDRVVEIKTISGFAAKQWDDEFNPAYGLQLMTYLMGLEAATGSIVTLKDGRFLTETILDYDEELVDLINIKTKDFWERVILGREAVEKGGDYDQFSPEPDGSRAYREFQKKMYATPEDEIIYNNSEELIDSARSYNALRLEMDSIETEQNRHRAILCDFMGNNYSQIDFGPAIGKVTWRQNAKGVRTFRNNVKPI